MESKNHKVIRNFINYSESEEIIKWVDSLKLDGGSCNPHISYIGKSLNGKSYMFDISKNIETKYITEFQSNGNTLNGDLPEIIHRLIDRISQEINIPKKGIFLQVIDMNSGGEIKPHYDSSIPGFINYKCNLSILSHDYKFWINGEKLNISQGDLYCFEASLYKHWTDKFSSRRVMLSFGFILKYKDLGRNPQDPRCRMSERIQRIFQKLK